MSDVLKSRPAAVRACNAFLPCDHPGWPPPQHLAAGTFPPETAQLPARPTFHHPIEALSITSEGLNAKSNFALGDLIGIRSVGNKSIFQARSCMLRLVELQDRAQSFTGKSSCCGCWVLREWCAMEFPGARFCELVEPDGWQAAFPIFLARRRCHLLERPKPNR